MAALRFEGPALLRVAHQAGHLLHGAHEALAEAQEVRGSPAEWHHLPFRRRFEGFSKAFRRLFKAVRV